MLTHKQLFRMMQLAHRGFDLEAPGIPFDDWRHAAQKEACGKASTKDMNTGADFDACMLHFAERAQDERSIRYFAEAVERRLRHRIGLLLQQLGTLEGATYTWVYARAIGTHMRLPDTIEQATTVQLRAVIAALDSQRRRILAARGQHAPQRGNEGLGTRRARREHGKGVAA